MYPRALQKRPGVNGTIPFLCFQMARVCPRPNLPLCSHRRCSSYEDILLRGPGDGIGGFERASGGVRGRGCSGEVHGQLPGAGRIDLCIYRLEHKNSCRVLSLDDTP